MVRIANLKDIKQGIVLLKKHIKEFDFGQFNEDNTDYYEGLLTACINDKTVIISENNNIIDGVLLGMKIPNLLNPNKTQLHILVTWVNKDKRGSSIFYKMNKLLEKEFKMETIYYSIPETNINYNRLGYRKFQTMYIKDK